MTLPFGHDRTRREFISARRIENIGEAEDDGAPDACVIARSHPWLPRLRRLVSWSRKTIARRRLWQSEGSILAHP
jgi:hypothetical protein